MIKPAEVVPQISKPTAKPNQSGVIVEGIDNCLIRFSHCCSPVPGDKIVGYVTRGRGVAIHRADCINILHANSEDGEVQRLIPVRWADEQENNFQAMLYVTATDRQLLLMDIMAAIGEMKLSITNVNARRGKNNLAIMELTVEISDTEQLKKAIKNIQKVDGVISVVRRRQ